MRNGHCGSGGKLQRGMVLAAALIFLVVLSLVAAFTLRSAQSTEGISGAARTSELAFQSAEIALRHCERSLVEVFRIARGEAASYATTFVMADILPRQQANAWEVPGNWDAEPPAARVYVLPLALVNQNNVAYPTYKRPPECMVTPVPVIPAGETALVDTSVFVITARGFGPEVEPTQPGPNGRRPQGSEVWLQSNVTLE